ncbi:hypothetical protein BJH93_15220 [Kocuria polaris]|nr:hypothetical protein [Kocuria polaris]
MVKAPERSVRRAALIYTADHVQFDGQTYPSNGEGNFGIVAPRQRAWGATADRMEIGASVVQRISVRAGQGTLVPGTRQADLLTLGLVEEGSMELAREGGTSFTASAGDVFLYRTTERYDVVWNEDVVLLTAGVPLDVIDEFGMDHSVVDGPVGAETGLLEPTLRFLGAAADMDEGVTALDAYFVEKLIQEMFGALLLTSRGLRDVVERDAPGLYDRAVALITARRAERDLTPERIASEMNVSLRHLQREFSRHSTSVAATLRRLRVEQAIHLLTDARYDVLSVPDIAFHSGFASPQLLRRALAAHGWGSPLEIRSKHRQQTSPAT